MKNVGRVLFCAAFVLFMASGVFAARNAKAKAPKEVWVSKDKNGTLLTADSNGWANLNMDEEIDLEGYKFVQIECSSPDGKKFARVGVDFSFTPEQDENFDWDNSARIYIYNIGKKLALYQGNVFGEKQRYDAWQDGKQFFRTPEALVFDRLTIHAEDANYKSIPGVKFYVKKIVATNDPIGQTYTLDIGKKRFLALTQKEVWDDKSVHYCYNADLGQEFGTVPKVGDVVQIKLKGTNAFDLGLWRVYAYDWDESYGWRPIANDSLYQPALKKGQKIDRTIDLVIMQPGQKAYLEFTSFEGETTGPYLFYSGK